VRHQSTTKGDEEVAEIITTTIIIIDPQTNG
jgi:hypothetical protein